MGGTGVAMDHWVASTVSWIRTAVEFTPWLVDRLGLEADIDSAGDDPQ